MLLYNEISTYFFKLELKVIANTSQKIEYILVDHSLYNNKLYHIISLTQI